MRTNKTKVGAAIAFLFLLAACEGPGQKVMGGPGEHKFGGPTNTQTKCSAHDQCQVGISVGSACYVTVDWYTLEIAHEIGKTTITFNLGNNAGGWIFDDNGIDFAGNSDFSVVSASDHKIVVEDQNTGTRRVVPYTVNLKNTTAKCPYDPIIINGA